MPIRTLTIEHLPCELMLHIFEYLSVTDRNSSALTSTCWYEIINHLNYLMNDTVLVFDGDVPETPVVRYKKVRAVRLMRQVQLNNGCDIFWQSLAQTLTEIEFVHCELLTNESLIDILRQLKRLKVLKLYAPLFRRWKLFQKNRFLLNDTNIDDVRETLENITHLTLCDSKINDAHFMNLMQKLTNLSVFDATSLYFRSNPDENRHLSSRCLLEWIRSASATNLKALTLKNVDDLLLMGLSNMPQLKFCSLQLHHVRVETLADFIQRQISLQELKVDLTKCPHPENLIIYLQDIPCVTELRLGMSFTAINLSTFHKFSNLRKLSTHLAPTTLPSDGSEFNVENGQNPKLKELEIISDIPYSPGSLKTFTRMITNYKNVNCLTISGIILSDKEIQSIFRVMSPLQSLHITNCEKITDKGIIGGKYSSKQYSLENLRGLRCLTLSNCYQITDKSLKDINLPELQYLELNRAVKLTVKGIASLVENLPVLEELSLTSRTDIDKSWIGALKGKFKRLKKVSINASHLENNVNYCFPFDR